MGRGAASDTLGAMAFLVNGDARLPVPAHCLVGRSSTCAVRLQAPQVSSEHARLSFRDGSWIVRDLSSKNGTYLNGERLEPGSTRPLREGDRLCFGDTAAAWTLVDASPPTAMARRKSTDELLAADGGMLALPSPEEPLATLFEAEPWSWRIEIDGQTRAVDDGEVIELGDESFVLHLPVSVLSTVEASSRRLGVEDIELRFRVSLDEEAVEITVAEPTSARVLAPRAHHYAWLTLARARLRDRDAPGLSEAQRGWVFVDELRRMLSMDETKLNVEIYRIRQDLGALGISNAAAIVERRRGSRQLRIGTERLVVGTME